MKLKIEIDIDNDAFVDNAKGEAQRAINATFDRIAFGYFMTRNESINVKIMDGNGLSVGTLTVEAD